MKNYDIIGDVHGQADKLVQLLVRLGYTKQGGIYQHPDNIAVFLGDFIDRGPQQRQVIETIRAMVENGHALAVMGNHEFNAICYHTPDPHQNGEYLRPHSHKNTHQHQHFLNEFPLRHKETQSVIAWFRTLPVYLELETVLSAEINGGCIRIIHACWDQVHIDWLSQQSNHSNQLTDEIIFAASKQNSRAFNVIETLLKGPEIPLPTGASFKDKDGIERHNIRYKWWGREMATYREAALVPAEEKHTVPNIKLPDMFINCGYSINEAPVFFGHYWMTGRPEPLADNVACLDFSAGKQGPLVAYRWHNNTGCSNPPKIKHEYFVSV